MPAGLIDEQRGVRTGCDLGGDFGEVEVHRLGVASRHDALYRTLSDLDERGIKLTMDDFGTGYANYVTLAQFPFSTIKLDVGVIQRMSASYKGEMIARSSIQMAHYLGLDVVAEGIELDGCCWMNCSLPQKNRNFIDGQWL